MNNVLFDTPGPQTIKRHRIYSIVAVVAIIAVVAWFVRLLAVEGEFSYDLWEFAVTPAYIQVILEGLLTTLSQAVAAVLLAIVFGVLFGVGKLSDHAWVRWPSWVVVEFFRAVPLLLLIVFIFFAYGTGDGIGAYWSLVIGLTLYNGSVIAEILRAGVNSVPKGQKEAAYAIGLRKTQSMTLIQLPQAIKIMLPALISQFVVALKDTSLGYYIVAPGLTYVGRSVWGEFGNQLQVAIILAALYIIANLLLSGLATLAQRRLVGEQRPLDPANAAFTDAGDSRGGMR